MANDVLTVSVGAVRRFLIHALGVAGPPSFPDVAAALDRLEFVQMDSINVCGRIHDLILWSRVRDYTPDLLADALYTAPRQAFEYYFPNLSVLPLADYPFFVRTMRARRDPPGRRHGLTSEEETVAAALLAQMDTAGPLRTRAGGAEHGHTISGWGTRTKVATRVLEKLWLQGHLSVARRENFERWFDVTHRLLPAVAPHHEDNADLPTEAEERVFKIRKRLRARRLFRARTTERAALGPDAFTAVQWEGAAARPWHVLAEDAAALASAENLPCTPDVHLLAPLDPLVYDRERNRALFGFDYTWEVYTPAAKRRWGYYVLPILWGDRLAGRVDPKVDRKTRTLTLHSLRLEPDVNAEAIAAPLAARLAAYARFLGAERITTGLFEPDVARTPILAALRNNMETA